MALIKLFADPEDDTLPPPPPKLRGGDFPIDDLLLELHDQRQRQKRREAAFLSIIGHLCLAFLLLLNPKFFRTTPTQLVPPQEQLKDQQLTFLEMPKDLITKKKPVAPKAISDQDRHFDQQTKPLNSISAPPVRATPRPAPPPPGPAAPPQPATPPPAPQPNPNLPKPEPAPPKAEADNGLKLQDVPATVPHPKLNLDLSTSQIEKAIDDAAKDRAAHSAGVTSSAQLPRIGNPGGGGANPGSIGSGVQILTDTQGVDFSSYLARVVEIVQRNWYAVMPETVYMGTKGRVVIIFDIMANGSVPGQQLIGKSGTESLDNAAGASISASNPFPRLPPAFTGPSIKLEFSFYYNLQPESH